MLLDPRTIITVVIYHSNNKNRNSNIVIIVNKIDVIMGITYMQRGFIFESELEEPGRPGRSIIQPRD